MIKIIAMHNDHSVIIEFPSNEEVLYSKCMEIHVADESPIMVTVEEVIEPKELSILENKLVNLDELNYLAKRLDSFTDDELNQFYAAVDFKNVTGLKHLINFTFNLDKFTFIKNIGNMIEVGRRYTLNTEGSIPDNDRYDEKYAEIGRNLLGTGRGIFTDKGLLFVEDKPIEEIYDGQVFPAFAYKDFIVNVNIDYNGKTESIFLPDSDLVVGKALTRLGAPHLEDCKLSIEYENPNYEGFFNHFDDVLKRNGIIELNALLKSIYECDVDAKKLAAAIEYTGIFSAHDIGVLVNNLDDLELITDIQDNDYDEVGHYFINNSDDYVLSEELEDFFDFQKFGEYIADERSGQFVSDGFIYYDGNGDMSEILKQLDDADNSMTMGGM